MHGRSWRLVRRAYSSATANTICCRFWEPEVSVLLLPSSCPIPVLRRGLEARISVPPACGEAECGYSICTGYLRTDADGNQPWVLTNWETVQIVPCLAAAAFIAVRVL